MRPARNVFMHDLQIVFVVEFVARQNAELVTGPKERDRNHQGAGKLEGMVLRKGKIGVHLKAPSLERAIPARWLPSVSGTGRDHREGVAERRQLASRPRSGLIVGDPGPDQEAIHQERWDVSYGPRSTDNDHAGANLIANADLAEICSPQRPVLVSIQRRGKIELVRTACARWGVGNRAIARTGVLGPRTEEEIGTRDEKRGHCRTASTAKGAGAKAWVRTLASRGPGRGPVLVMHHSRRSP
uniref:Uncharacterized protein n=1 Tax=Agrobacterium tumefaciens TaxID=358 RepID=A0A5B9T1N1_AGRTU|nr:hypothetical protein AgrTiKerr108_00109 [Agrobacterium tumefaciens]